MSKLWARFICWFCRPAIEVALAEADRRRIQQIDCFERTGSFNPQFLLLRTEADTEIDKLGFVHCMQHSVKEYLHKRLSRDRGYREAVEAARVRRILEENKPAAAKPQPKTRRRRKK